MITYVLDTNTISYFLRGEGNVRENIKRELSERGNSYAMPFVIFYEVKRWLFYKPTKLMKEYNQKFDAMFQNTEDKADMPFNIWKKAIEVYISLQSKGQLIGDADILIASYCLVNNYTLVTRNTSDFERIDGLKFVNWY